MNHLRNGIRFAVVVFWLMAQADYAYGVEIDGLHRKEKIVNLSAGILREFVGEPFPIITRPAPFEDK